MKAIGEVGRYDYHLCLEIGFCDAVTGSVGELVFVVMAYFGDGLVELGVELVETGH